MNLPSPVPGHLSPKGAEAVHELLRCIEEGFTGTLQFEFKDGIPQLRRRTDTHRFGRADAGTP